MATVEVLLSARGRALIDAAATLLAHHSAPAAALALAALAPDADPALRAACLAQAVLLRRARELGLELRVASDAGLQQASRPEAARHRARSLTARHGSLGTVADLGCGLGTDSRALAETGWGVQALDADPWTADAARANLTGLPVTVVTGQAQDLDPTGIDVAFCDPARRVPGPAGPLGRVPPERDPERWSPPWSWVRDLARQRPTAAKVAPGLPPSFVPDDAEAEWVAVGADVVELVVWFSPLAETARRATLLAPGTDEILASLVHEGPGQPPPRGAAENLGTHLIEPHPVVRTAGLVDTLAIEVERDRVSSASNWLTGDAVDHPLARTWRVITQLPWPTRRLRAALAAHRPASVTWKTRDVGLSADALSARVAAPRSAGGPNLTVVVYRSAHGPAAVLVTAAPKRTPE